MRRMTVAAILAGTVVLGCSAAAPTTAPVTPRPTTAPTPTVARVPESLSLPGSGKTGLTKTFTLRGGSYEAKWATTANVAGCTFYLFLATTPDGPTVADVSDTAILPSKKDYSGTHVFTAPAGSYIVQQDRSGLVDCSSAFSLTITSL